MSRFTEGQKVKALETAQGMKAGEVFTVEFVQRGSFGVVAYIVRNGRTPRPLVIYNGHILLTEAQA